MRVATGLIRWACKCGRAAGSIYILGLKRAAYLGVDRGLSCNVCGGQVLRFEPDPDGQVGIFRGESCDQAVMA